MSSETLAIVDRVLNRHGIAKEFISVDYGICIGVSKSRLDDAQRDANNTGLIHYIGTFSDGTEVLGTSRQALLDLGVDSLVAIIPQRNSLSMLSPDEHHLNCRRFGVPNSQALPPCNCDEFEGGVL